ncbi:MAG: hypothetical protein C00003105_01955 [ANME-2 cluster archaeon HR1]|nr:MAG: hypothetical protein C00003105_01955 [ANME-2 cluster archaeon HR1]
MNVFKVCVFYIIVYINLLIIKSYLYRVVGNNVQEVERDVISRENLNLYRQHHAQSSSFHSLTYRRDIDVDIKLSYLKKYDKLLSQNINLMISICSQDF